MTLLREKLLGTVVTLTAVAVMFLGVNSALADPMPKLDKEVQSALENLYQTTSKAKELGGEARGILVFPKITKAGFLIAGQAGDGALLVDGKTDGYYKTGGASIGLQAGGQTYGYVLFFMTDADLEHLNSDRGLEIGVGPSITIIDTGAAVQMSTATAKSGIYAFVFNQKGLMGGIGLQGNKIHPLK